MEGVLMNLQLNFQMKKLLNSQIWKEWFLFCQTQCYCFTQQDHGTSLDCLLTYMFQILKGEDAIIGMIDSELNSHKVKGKIVLCEQRSTGLGVLMADGTGIIMAVQTIDEPAFPFSFQQHC